MTKHEICVHIKDDEMLQQAKELLEKHGEEIHKPTFCITSIHLDYLQCSFDDNLWYLTDKDGRTEITLDQLEGVLNN